MKNIVTIKEDYVSFETAELLKEKGFDEHCSTSYNTILSNHKVEESRVSEWGRANQIYRPTLQMAMKWLREQNKIISILHSYVTNKYKIIITQFNKLDIADLNNTLYSSNDYDYFSYEEAVEVAIKYCLEHLI